MTKKVFDRMKTAVLLVNLLLGQGLSDVLVFRHNWRVVITEDTGKKYTLQLCSPEICKATNGTRACNKKIYETLTQILSGCTSKPSTYECVASMFTPCGSLTTTHSASVPTYAYTSTPASCSQDTISRTALGSMVGLLIVLLAVVTTGWVWTCWIMKKQGQMRIVNSSVNTRWAKKKQKKQP